MDATWYVSDDGKTDGPISQATMEARIHAGFVTKGTWISRNSKDFTPAAEPLTDRYFLRH